MENLFFFVRLHRSKKKKGTVWNAPEEFKEGPAGCRRPSHQLARHVRQIERRQVFALLIESFQLGDYIGLLDCTDDAFQTA